jgi:hypothetical protein
MTSVETQPSAPELSRRFQSSLWALLLLFMVLGPSLAEFGA